MSRNHHHQHCVGFAFATTLAYLQSMAVVVDASYPTQEHITYVYDAYHFQYRWEPSVDWEWMEYGNVLKSGTGTNGEWSIYHPHKDCNLRTQTWNWRYAPACHVNSKVDIRISPAAIAMEIVVRDDDFWNGPDLFFDNKMIVNDAHQKMISYNGTDWLYPRPFHPYKYSSVMMMRDSVVLDIHMIATTNWDNTYFGFTGSRFPEPGEQYGSVPENANTIHSFQETPYRSIAYSEFQYTSCPLPNPASCSATWGGQSPQLNLKPSLRGTVQSDIPVTSPYKSYGYVLADFVYRFENLQRWTWTGGKGFGSRGEWVSENPMDNCRDPNPDMSSYLWQPIDTGDYRLGPACFYWTVIEIRIRPDAVATEFIVSDDDGKLQNIKRGSDSDQLLVSFNGTAIGSQIYAEDYAHVSLKRDRTIVQLHRLSTPGKLHTIYMFTGSRLPQPGEEYDLIRELTESWWAWGGSKKDPGYPYRDISYAEEFWSACPVIEHTVLDEVYCTITECENGFVLNANGTACTECAAVAHLVSFGAGCEVASCESGYSANEAKSSCVACSVPKATSYGAGCAVAGCESGYRTSADGKSCICRPGFFFDPSRQQCFSDIFNCNTLLLQQNANQTPGPHVPGTCNAIFAACSTDGSVSELTQAEWDGCEVDKAMDPTLVQAFAMVDSDPRNGTVSREEYAAFHQVSVDQVEDLVFKGRELPLTSFRHEPLTAAQETFDRLDINNTGRVCCVAGINGGEPFVLRQFEDYVNGLPAAEAQRQLDMLMSSGLRSFSHGSAWSPSESLRSLSFSVAAVVAVFGIVLMWRRGTAQRAQGEPAGATSSQFVLVE